MSFEPSADPVRIALVCASYGAGGLEKHILDLSAALAAQGAAVTVIAHPSYAGRLGQGIGFLPWNPDGPRWLPWRRWALKKALREAAPDIVHAHGDKAAALVAALAPGAVPKAKRVATCHNHRRAPRAYAGFHRVIAVSQALAKALTHPDVTVVYHGLQTAPAAPSDPLDIPGRPLALAVGRLVPQKGFDILLEAWQGVPAHLWIAGEGPERGRLEQRIAAGNLGDRVRLLGHREDIPALLDACDFFVLSSRHEAYGYVLAEALLAKRPVVAVHAGGLDEILPRTLPQNDVPALTSAILAAAKDPAALGREQAELFDYAEKHLTLAAMAKETLKVYGADAAT